MTFSALATAQTLVFFHGAGGASPDDPLLAAAGSDIPGSCTRRGRASVTDETETAIEDMLDFTLHGWDLVDALELARTAADRRPFHGCDDRGRDGKRRPP